MLILKKTPNAKLPGNMGHHEKTKPKIIGIEEEESQFKNLENIFDKIIEENSPNLRKGHALPIKVQ